MADAPKPSPPHAQQWQSRAATSAFQAASSSLHLVEQVQNHPDTWQVHFQFFGQGTNQSRPSECRRIVKRLTAGGNRSVNWSDEFLVLPKGKLSLADSGEHAESRAAHQRGTL